MIRLATMTSVCPDWGVGEIIDGMKRHGFEGLEPRAGWGHAAGIELDMAPADRDAVRAKFEDADLRICCVATGARFATEDADALNGHIDEANAAIVMILKIFMIVLFFVWYICECKCAYATL